ncbi:MAG TPA: hypothetical protein VJM08_02865 [Anaerolineales bacterium]|nr:hypothetical protein [Anaerolineales bacterium]
MKTLSSSLDHQGHESDDPKRIVKPIGKSMTPTKTSLFTFVAVILFLICFGAVAQSSTPLDTELISAATALTIITASAVGIERAIETFWTYIGLTRGSWWPLGPVREQLDGLISGLDNSFEPFYEEAQTTMQKLQQAQTWGEDKLDTAARDLDKIKKHVDELRQLPIDSQRVKLIVNSASRSVDYFSQKYPEIKEAAVLARFGIEGVTNFVETFKDNPGRRLISLFAGSIVGMAIAGVIGLDIFEAVLGVPIPLDQGPYLPHAGVALTGLLMGLGASPTHEAIRLLQEVKKLRSAQNN